MQRPDRGHRQRDAGGVGGKSTGEWRKQQGAADQPKEDERRENVEGEVDDVVATHVEPVQSVVERHRQVRKWAAANAGLGRREQHGGGRPEAAYGGVFDDRRLVVENEFAGEAVGVGQQHGGDERERGEREAQAFGHAAISSPA